MNVKVNSIRARMYNTGSVGDCILYQFLKEDTITFSMLIDCGGWNAPIEEIKKCVEDISVQTKNHLNLLVVTHQHLDHISGFNQCREIFDQMAVDEVWMSWVEDGLDDIAKILKEKFGKKIKELKITAEECIVQLKNLSNSTVPAMRFSKIMKQRQELMEDALSLLKFEEGLNEDVEGVVKGRQTNSEAMEYVRQKGKKLRYLKPGEVVKNLIGAEGINFFILGPPRDKDLKFLQIDMNEDEMYKLAIKDFDVNDEEIISEHLFATSNILQNKVSPFEQRFAMSGPALHEFNTNYNLPKNQWRQIETDGMEAIASIALRMTRFTNNTSLAMALEFEESGRVMLLPADAQSGNWMSWHTPDVTRDLMANGSKNVIDLLKNTVFYKVGHHGSHNGTASRRGLELINTPDLVAMMPLVQNKIPRQWGGASNFPAKALYKTLIEKARGRVIRTDEGLIKDSRASQLRASQPAPLIEALTQADTQNKFYVEYVINGVN